MKEEEYQMLMSELKPAVKTILAEMAADSDDESVPFDVLCLAVKSRFKKLQFTTCVDAVERLLKEQSIERQGYECRIPILDLLASL